MKHLVLAIALVLGGLSDADADAQDTREAWTYEGMRAHLGELFEQKEYAEAAAMLERVLDQEGVDEAGGRDASRLRPGPSLSALRGPARRRREHRDAEAELGVAASPVGVHRRLRPVVAGREHGRLPLAGRGAHATVKRGLRGSLFTTELDRRVEAQRALAERWKKPGLDGEFTVTPNIGHWFPKDFGRQLDGAIERILAPLPPRAPRWTRMASGTTNNLTGLWGTSLSDMFAVGPKGTTEGVGVFGVAPRNVFVVGGGGTILRHGAFGRSEAP